MINIGNDSVQWMSVRVVHERHGANLRRCQNAILKHLAYSCAGVASAIPGNAPALRFYSIKVG
jgi:hypothetical protein